MARIRSIHPEACDSEKLSMLSDSAERTFFRLLTHIDDEGRAEDRPKLLAAKLYPLHDGKSAETVDADLADIESVGLLVRYSVKGRCYLAIPTFGDWQKPRHPTPSKFPAPEEHDGSAEADGGSHTDNDGSPTADRSTPTDELRPGGGGGGGEGVEVEPSGGDAGASRNGHDSRPFTERCEDYLAAQGIKIPPAEQELDHRQTILSCMVDEAEDAHKARQASIAIVADYLQFLTGKKLRGEARDHAWSLVGEFGGAETLRSAYEAVRNAAGLDPKYHGDPLAVTKYMSAVLHGHGSKEAS